MIPFPFERDRYYPVGELEHFEAQVLSLRQEDPALSARLRGLTDQEWEWVKPRHDELLPLLCCVRHGVFGSDVQFRLMPEGHIADICVLEQGKETQLQVTVADPKWPGSQGGSQRHLHVELLNQGGITPGFGPYWRERGQVRAEHRAISGAELDAAYRGGIFDSLNRKAKRDGAGLTLLIYCRAYNEAMDVDRFRQLVREASADAIPNSFDDTWFASNGPEFFCTRNRQQ